MSCKNSDNPNRVDGSAKKTVVVKDMILFFGELVRASVEGVVEFWGNGKTETESSVQVVNVPEAGAADLFEAVEEVPVYEVLPVYEEFVEADVDSPSVEELKAQVKELKREEKLARKEEKREQKLIRKAEKCEQKTEKKAERYFRKQEDQLKKQARQQEKDEKKLVRKDQKKVRKVKYISKDMILSKTEKKFYDEMRSAIGLRYIIRTRVDMADVLMHVDGTMCDDEELGEMDFGVYDLWSRLKVLVEVKGMRRQDQQSQKEYREVERLCREASIPVIIFKAKHINRRNYVKKRMKDFLNIR